MRILIGCEFSGIVRDAFIRKGHYAVSCDLIPTESPGNHLIGRVENHLNSYWDMLIAFPPCTYLCVSGARWFKDRPIQQRESLEFVKLLMNAPIQKIAIENPIGVISTKIRKPDQIIQPYQFGDNVKKSTCLWLKNLPKLVPSNIVEPEIITMKDGKKMSKFHYDTFALPKSKRGMERSRTFPGIAEAMANQWG